MVYEHSGTVQRHRQSGNLKVSITDGLTGVGATDDNIHVYCIIYILHIACILLVRFAHFSESRSVCLSVVRPLFCLNKSLFQVENSLAMQSIFVNPPIISLGV